MIVRIRWGRREPSATPMLQGAALAVASLLTPAALIAFTVTLWSLGAELRLAARFFISGGIFSHWQVWLLGAVGLSCFAWLLNRYARSIGQNYAN